MSKAEYEEYFKEPGTLKNRVERYVKSNIGTGDAYGKMIRLLDAFPFTSIQNSEIDWNNANTIEL